MIENQPPLRDLQLLVEVGIDYTSDLPQVERVVTDLARGVVADMAGGMADFNPFVWHYTFGDSSICFSALLRAPECVDLYRIKQEFSKRLRERFDRVNIVIPPPRG
jgi:small-conductance mechanosensitive channel